jgi:hypothetical protein
MKKFILILSVLLFPVKCHAITWNQFWAPFEHRPYDSRYQTPYVPSCVREIVHTEYVPANYWNSAYVRVWSELVRVPCNY